MDDDRRIDRVFDRREALGLLAGTGSALLLAACGADGNAVTASINGVNANLPSGCVVRPAMTEGPIFVDDQTERSDIRTDPTTGVVSEGAPLALTFRVSALADTTCTALAGAKVDLWQCDAFGIYSDTDFDGMDTVGQRFLRGHQFTDTNGMCTFLTVFPGWYPSRAVHVHLKIRTADDFEFTSQLFFDPATIDEVFATAPYNSRGERAVRNADDGAFGNGGDQMVLDVQPTADGYQATFAITLDLT